MGECFFSNPFISCFQASSLVEYPAAMSLMMDAVAQVINKQSNSSNILWFLEHPSLYTAGASTSVQNLVAQSNCPIYNTDRGGKYTYHGPGQLVVYMAINIKALYNGRPDIKKFVADISRWLVVTLNELGVQCEQDPRNIGIWCKQKKIASIGLKLKKWVAYHGIAINLHPDLSYFSYISPCGLNADVISSLESLSYKIRQQDLINSLVKNFLAIFNKIDH